MLGRATVFTHVTECMCTIIVAFCHFIPPQGGKAVRLFHKEDECYIVAEGSFASSSPVLENGIYH